jgi:hypothetical protein
MALALNSQDIVNKLGGENLKDPNEYCSIDIEY